MKVTCFFFFGRPKASGRKPGSSSGGTASGKRLQASVAIYACKGLFLVMFGPSATTACSCQPERLRISESKVKTYFGINHLPSCDISTSSSEKGNSPSRFRRGMCLKVSHGKRTMLVPQVSGFPHVSPLFFLWPRSEPQKRAHFCLNRP